MISKLVLAAGASAEFLKKDKEEWPSSKKCQAVAFSGGGSHGAYETGVLWSFVKEGNPKDFEYDVVTGVSAGSINALGVSIFEKGDELNMVEWMFDFLSALGTPDVYK